jgi:hypothetical protein
VQTFIEPPVFTRYAVVLGISNATFGGQIGVSGSGIK